MYRPLDVRESRPAAEASRPWKIVTDLFQTAQVRQILGVALGAASAQGVLLLASPVLTRLYTPTDFGIYSYFYAALGFLTPAATLRYELAIPLPKSISEARQVGLASLLASLSVGALVAVLLVVGVQLGVPPIANASYSFLIGLPLGVSLAGTYQTLTYWAVRHDRFRSIAYARGGLGLGTSVGQMLLGAMRFGPPGLILGDLVGRFSAAGSLVISLQSTLRGAGQERRFDRGAVLRQATKFRGFPLVATPSVLMNSLGLFLPLFAVGHFYSAGAAGLLFLAQRVIGLPAALLTSASAQVYIGEFTKIEETDRPALYDSTLKRLAALTGIPFIIGALAAPALFPILFGAEWGEAGQIGMLLAPFYFLQLLSGATVSTLDTLELHGARFLREAVFLVVTVAVFAAPFVLRVELPTLIAVYSFTGALFYCGSIIFVRALLGEVL